MSQLRPVRHQLHHEDHDQPGLGIDQIGRAVGAAPAGTRRPTPAVRAIAIHRLEIRSRSPGRSWSAACRLWLVVISATVRGDEHAHAVERAAVAGHLEEPRVIAGRRDQSGATGKTLPRALDVVALAARAVRRADDRAVGAARVDGREPIAIGGRQEEPRVLHAERRRDPRRDELIERHAGRALDDAAEDVGVVAVDVGLARLRDERQRRQPLHRRAGAFVLVRGVPAESRRRSEPLGLVQRRHQRVGAVRDARGVRQQIADRDRPAAPAPSSRRCRP